MTVIFSVKFLLGVKIIHLIDTMGLFKIINLVLGGKGIVTSLYRVSQEERTKLREGVPYVKLYRYNPEHLCPKLNGY